MRLGKIGSEREEREKRLREREGHRESASEQKKEQKGGVEWRSVQEERIREDTVP